MLLQYQKNYWIQLLRGSEIRRNTIAADAAGCHNLETFKRLLRHGLFEMTPKLSNVLENYWFNGTDFARHFPHPNPPLFASAFVSFFRLTLQLPFFCTFARCKNFIIYTEKNVITQKLITFLCRLLPYYLNLINCIWHHPFKSIEFNHL